MPRGDNPLEELLERAGAAVQATLLEFVNELVSPQYRAQPQPCARRVSAKPPKVKKPKAERQAKRERAEQAEPTFYEILEVSPKASPETITAAFRSLAKRFHPDGKNGAEAKRCEMRMILLNLAYEKLADPKCRSEYDAKLKQEAR